MRYSYCTISCFDNTEVAHSEKKKDDTVEVYFETPDESLGFKTLTVELPSYEIKEKNGYSAKGVQQLILFCKKNAVTIIRYATVGGWDNA